MTTFGERLSTLRAQRGLSQADLALRLNIAKSTLAMYETNKREPGFEIIQRIADFFGKDVDYLLGRSTTGGNPKDPEEAFGQWVRMRAKKDNFTPEELAKLEKRVKNILRELDEELFD